MGTLAANIGGIRFYFLKSELQEPPHVHFTDGKNVGKIWLESRVWAVEAKFNANQKRKINAVIKKHQKEWHKKVAKSIADGLRAAASKSR
jgi:primosomal replication protein N